MEKTPRWYDISKILLQFYPDLWPFQREIRPPRQLGSALGVGETLSQPSLLEAHAKLVRLMGQNTSKKYWITTNVNQVIKFFQIPSDAHIFQRFQNETNRRCKVHIFRMPPHALQAGHRLPHHGHKPGILGFMAGPFPPWIPSLPRPWSWSGPTPMPLVSELLKTEWRQKQWHGGRFIVCIYEYNRNTRMFKFDLWVIIS